LIVKLFAGIEGEDQHIVPHDPNNSLQGSALGLQLQAESWLDNAKFPLRRRKLRHRLPGILVAGTAGGSVDAALGLEGGALGNEEYAAGRGGGFARMNFRAIEVTLSGGFTGNYLEDQPSGYVALGLYRPF